MNETTPFSPALFRQEIEKHIEVVRASEALAGQVAELARLGAAALRAGSKWLLFGNGGSAADAQHIAAELVGRYQAERRALPAIALTTDTSALTAIANDYGFAQVFARQVAALAAPGDLVVAISTSGQSESVLAGMREARARGCVVVGLTGGDGGRMREAADLVIAVPSRVTARVQEVHILIGHTLCLAIERDLAGAST